MSTIRYRESYEVLGEERVQQGPVVNRNAGEESSALAGRGSSDAKKGYFISEAELFWSVRRDYHWSKLPGVFK